jgi:hypothetical protein
MYWEVSIKDDVQFLAHSLLSCHYLVDLRYQNAEKERSTEEEKYAVHLDQAKKTKYAGLALNM